MCVCVCVHVSVYVSMAVCMHIPKNNPAGCKGSKFVLLFLLQESKAHQFLYFIVGH